MIIDISVVRRNISVIIIISEVRRNISVIIDISVVRRNISVIIIISEVRRNISVSTYWRNVSRNDFQPAIVSVYYVRPQFVSTLLNRGQQPAQFHLIGFKFLNFLLQFIESLFSLQGFLFLFFFRRLSGRFHVFFLPYISVIPKHLLTIPMRLMYVITPVTRLHPRFLTHSSVLVLFSAY